MWSGNIFSGKSCNLELNALAMETPFSMWQIRNKKNLSYRMTVSSNTGGWCQFKIYCLMFKLISFDFLATQIRNQFMFKTCIFKVRFTKYCIQMPLALMSKLGHLLTIFSRTLNWVHHWLVKNIIVCDTSFRNGMADVLNLWSQLSMQWITSFLSGISIWLIFKGSRVWFPASPLVPGYVPGTWFAGHLGPFCTTQKMTVFGIYLCE